MSKRAGIVAVRDGDEPFVTLDGKCLTLQEFERLYPDRTIIHLVDVDTNTTP